MKILAKKHAIDSDMVELFCSFSKLEDNFRFLVAVAHIDCFDEEQFPCLHANDEANLILTEET